MKKVISWFTALCVILSAFTAVYAAEIEGKELLYSQTFNGYATNSVPDDLSVDAVSYFIKEYAERNKGLFVSTFKKDTTVSFDFNSAKKICISFDMMSTGKDIEGSFNIKSSSGIKTALLKFAALNKVCAFDGRQLSGYSSRRMTKYTLCINPENKTMDFYVDSRAVYKGYRLIGVIVSDIASIEFAFNSSDEVSYGYVIDNVNINSGLSPLKDYPTAVYNENAEEEKLIKTKAEVGGGVIINEGFENAVPFMVASRSNTIAQCKDGDNTAVQFERFNSSDFHMDAQGAYSSSDYVVYELDFKVEEPDTTSFIVRLKDDNAVYSSVFDVSAGATLILGGKEIKITKNKWYHISAVYNYFDRVRDFYVDGNAVAQNIAIEAGFSDASKVGVFRVYCGAAADVAAMHAKFLIDNMRVYESDKPLDDISDAKREIKINEKNTIFDYNNIKALLDGYYAFHTRSAAVYKDGEKSYVKTVPEKTGAQSYAVAEELCMAFGIGYASEGADIIIGGRKADNSIVEERKGIKYINVVKFFEQCLGMKTYVDETCDSGGMIIAGENEFKPPVQEETLQELNNYLFYIKPSAADVAVAYDASPLKGVHPRIQATKADFEKIKEEIKTNSLKAEWAKEVFERADLLLKERTPLIYELRDGVRLLHVSRDCLKNMYTLGMAYQLTGNKAYAERAWVDLESVCSFPDWHPKHDIDVSEMCAAVAVGYDWMYDAFSEEQRRAIENGIYQNGFYPFALAYQTKNGPFGGVVLTRNNHNIVLNGGATVAALAFMDIYPEIAQYIAAGAINASDRMLVLYGPDGAWYEGPHYWEYATQYMTKMFSSLNSALNTTFRLDLTEGLSTTANYILNFQSDTGIFNYGDGTQVNLYVPEMYWLGNNYGEKGVTEAVIKMSGGKAADIEDSVLSLLWYDTGITSDNVSMSKDSLYPDEGATFRDDWISSGEIYAAVHAGYTSRKKGMIIYHSQLDAGTFVYDYGGIRWAEDLGMAPYDLPETADYSEFGTRWRMYKARAESHNTVVVNPDSGPDHSVLSKAEITRFETKERGGIAVVDMSDVLKKNTVGAKRGLFFTDNRTSLVVRDEINLETQSDVYWFMQTTADVEINGNTAILSKNGKKVKFEYISNAATEIVVEDSKPLPTSPTVNNDIIPNAKRIRIVAKGLGDINITAKLTPVGMADSGVEKYNTPIDTWQIPDGAIPEKPSLRSAQSGGTALEFDSGRSAKMIFPYGKFTSVPDIEIDCDTDKYIAEIKTARDFNSQSEIKLTDKNDAENYVTYTVKYAVIPKAAVIGGRQSVQIANIIASAEPQPENNIMNVLDGDLSTRWSAQGTGQYIIIELENEAVLDSLMIAFASGNVRKTKFDISLSSDGNTWDKIFDDWSGGESTEYEQYSLGARRVRYIKIGCDGNSAQGIGGWNSITEIAVTGIN